MKVLSRIKMAHYRGVWSVALHIYLFMGNKYDKIAKWARSAIIQLREEINQ